MDQTVGGDVQQDVDVAAPDLTVSHRSAVGVPAQAPDLLPPDVADRQIAVGDIPAESSSFRPRAGLLAGLERAGARILVIHGTAGRQGVGATQLAAAYARTKLSASWRLVAWVNAADTGTMQAGLAEVAEATGLADGGSGRDTADAGHAVRHLLEADGDRCLLVFDGVKDSEALRPFLPVDGAAQVLITSTRHLALDRATAVPVDVFNSDEALLFLNGQTGLDDEAGAAEVAAVLGYLPLALALAAPVIRGQRHGYARYLDRLQTMPTEVSPAGDGVQPYPQGFARAVRLSLAAIRAADKTGMCTRVIAIMAVLSAAGVRRELLHVAGRAGVLASGGRRVPADLVDQVLEWLSDRSLLTFSLDGQTVMMHHLVAQVIRDGLARRQRLGAVCWVAASVLEAHAIAVAGSQDRPAVRRIPQQVTALLDDTEFAGGADEELVEILLRLRFIALYHLIELGDVSQAIAVGEPLITDLERLLGPGHPDTLNARNSLAAAFLAADRIPDAIALFEQTLLVLQRRVGPDHLDTLTSQNNLASAYQDAGRVGEAIRLYELNLAARERLLGADHPGTLNSRGNLAAAYLAASRVGEAIPLLEQTLASRERVLGPDHLDTNTSRKNLAKAYQDVGRVAEAIRLLERTSAGRHRVLRPDHRDTRISRTSAARASPASAKGVEGLSVSFRRPPAASAGAVLPGGFRRPPADLAGRLSDRVAGPAKPLDHSSPSRKQDASLNDAQYDREVVAAVGAGDPAGLAMAYDRYAAALYGYCHWMLRDSPDAAESLQDTFVLAAATLSELPESSKLRPWLFALARSECRRRIRPMSATREEAGAADQRANGGLRAYEANRPVGTAGVHADATMPIDVVSEPSGLIGGPADATLQFRAISRPTGLVGGSADATVQFPMVGQLADATMQFHLVSESAAATDGFADVNGYLGQAELRELIRSILADMKPREREVIELSFRYGLYDHDLAIALGVSWSRAHALASRTRGRLEKSFATLRTALAGRQACPVMGELLADWDGQLTEQTRDLVAWHTEQCQTCINRAQGGLRPTVLSGLLPQAPLPPDLRRRVLSRCSSSAEDAVAYRRRVVRRAESRWAALFSQAVRQVSWASIRANPGPAVAMTAVALWAAAAVTVILLTIAGSHAAHAEAAQPTGSHATRIQTAQPSAGTFSGDPVLAPPAAAAPTSAAARPSSRRTRRPAYISSPVQSSPTREASTPSRSPSPTPSESSSPSPSPSPSPATRSPSSSPSPTA